MKIFLSWSGPHSRAIADALNDWLRRIIQAVKPFYSPEIDKGAKWSGEIDNALEGTSFGIICLTRDNLNSPWIHFEAGALSKTKDAMICTFLHGLTPGDVPPPLGKFQHTVAEKNDTLLLLKTINRRLGEVVGESITEKLLEENFETFWPQLEAKLKTAEGLVHPTSEDKFSSSREGPREQREILDEILELARNQERRLSDFEDRLEGLRAEPAGDSDKSKRVVTLRVPFFFSQLTDAESSADKLQHFVNTAVKKTEFHRLRGKGGVELVITFDPPISQRRVDQLMIEAGAYTGYAIVWSKVTFA